MDATNPWTSSQLPVRVFAKKEASSASPFDATPIPTIERPGAMVAHFRPDRHSGPTRMPVNVYETNIGPLIHAYSSEKTLNHSKSPSHRRFCDSFTSPNGFFCITVRLVGPPPPPPPSGPDAPAPPSRGTGLRA